MSASLGKKLEAIGVSAIEKRYRKDDALFVIGEMTVLLSSFAIVLIAEVEGYPFDTVFGWLETAREHGEGRDAGNNMGKVMIRHASVSSACRPIVSARRGDRLIGEGDREGFPEWFYHADVYLLLHPFYPGYGYPFLGLKSYLILLDTSSCDLFSGSVQWMMPSRKQRFPVGIRKFRGQPPNFRTRENTTAPFPPQAHYANEDNGTGDEWSASLILPCYIVSLTG